MPRNGLDGYQTEALEHREERRQLHPAEANSSQAEVPRSTPAAWAQHQAVCLRKELGRLSAHGAWPAALGLAALGLAALGLAALGLAALGLAALGWPPRLPPSVWPPSVWPPSVVAALSFSVSDWAEPGWGCG